MWPEMEVDFSLLFRFEKRKIPRKLIALYSCHLIRGPMVSAAIVARSCFNCTCTASVAVVVAVLVVIVALVVS